MEADSLNFKLLADQIIQIHPTRDDISTHRSSRVIWHLEREAKLLEHLKREEGDLSLVIRLVIEEAITANSVACHAINPRHFDRRVLIRFAAMVAKEIMTGRNVEVKDLWWHRLCSNDPAFLPREEVPLRPVQHFGKA